MDLLKKPSTDFAAVRDGRQSMPLYIDVDLTTARSISGKNPLILNIAGNSFFTDADTTNGGNAIVHFQDTNLGNASAPFFVSPGFIANVGFTQLLIENTAQAGKRMRIFYGVDIDFQAGVNASIAITGSVSVTSLPNQRLTYTGSYKANTNAAANTAEQIFAPGSNVNGAILNAASIMSYASTGPTFPNLIAKTSAPANITDGDVLLSTDQMILAGSNYFSAASLKQPIFIDAGKGLYFIAGSAETSLWSNRSALYTLL